MKRSIIRQSRETKNTISKHLEDEQLWEEEEENEQHTQKTLNWAQKMLLGILEILGIKNQHDPYEDRDYE